MPRRPTGQELSLFNLGQLLRATQVHLDCLSKAFTRLSERSPLNGNVKIDADREPVSIVVVSYAAKREVWHLSAYSAFVSANCGQRLILMPIYQTFPCIGGLTKHFRAFLASCGVPTRKMPTRPMRRELRRFPGNLGQRPRLGPDYGRPAAPRPRTSTDQSP